MKLLSIVAALLSIFWLVKAAMYLYAFSPELLWSVICVFFCKLCVIFATWAANQ